MDLRARDHRIETRPQYELGAVVATLGDDEVRVLTRIARRLAMGQRTYGRLALASDGRDFGSEAREEVEDFLVYVACGWLRKEVGR